MKQSFLQGTVILLITSLLLRGMGFLYQIVVVRHAGTESVGILNMTMPFYIILVVMTTAGMPVAIAKLTAAQVSGQSEAQITRIMATAFRLVAVLCCCNVLVALLVMPQLFGLLETEPRVRYCFYVLIPGIVIVPFTSVMRGYFQGRQQMLYPSLGQLTEQVIRVVSGVLLLLWVCPQTVTALAMGLAAAAMIGELGGFLLLGSIYLVQRHRLRTAAQQEAVPVLGQLLTLGVPTTMTRLTSSVDMAIEASLVPRSLALVGYNTSQSAGIYGQFSGVAVSLLTIPTVLTGALATALIPAISEAHARGYTALLEQRCRQSLAITWCCSLPVIGVLYCYGEELGQLLFHLDGLGEMMQILALGAMFLYLGQTVVGILQGLGCTREVFVTNLAGSAAKLAGMYWCIVPLGWGSNGIAGGMVIGYGLQCLLNLMVLSRMVSLRVPWRLFLLPVLGCAGLLGLARLILPV